MVKTINKFRKSKNIRKDKRSRNRRTRNRRIRNRRTRNKRRKTKNLRGGSKLEPTSSSERAFKHQWEARDENFPYSKKGPLDSERHNPKLLVKKLFLIIDARNIFPKGSNRSGWPPKGEEKEGLRNFLLADYYGKGKNIYQHMHDSGFNALSLIICDFENFSKSKMRVQDFKAYINSEIEMLERVNKVGDKRFKIELDYTYLVGLSEPVEYHTNKDIIMLRRENHMEFDGPDFSDRSGQGKLDKYGNPIGECTWVKSIAQKSDWDHEFCGLDDHLAILIQKKLQRLREKSVLLSSDREIYETSNEALLKYYTVLL